MEKHVLFFLLLCSSSFLFISCSDDESANLVSPCLTNLDNPGTMTSNGENFFIHDNFIASTSIPSTSRSLVLNGFNEDCNQRQQLEIDFNLEIIGEPAGDYVFSQSSTTAGTASGSLLTQEVETLEQSRSNIDSGSFTITESDAGELSINLEVVTDENITILINTPINGF